MQTASYPSIHEQAVLQIMRRLPPERLVELVDFARFLEFQATVQDKGWLEDDAAEDQWDQLLARPEAKRLMREMAHEARADYQAGQTTDLHITEEGRLSSE
jgi:hypothetical protein